MGKRKSWQELTSNQRAAIVVLGAAEVALTTWAAWDLFNRPAAQVRGSKVLWAPLLFVQPVGPISYLALGRRHDQ